MAKTKEDKIYSETGVISKMEEVKIMKRFAAALVLIILMFGTISANAGDTRRWEINSFADWEKGQMNGLEVDSSGSVSPVWDTSKEEVQADGIWAMASTKSGIYMGTGNDGKLFVSKNGKIKEVFDTGRVAITAVKEDSSGTIWFSAIPGGAVYKMVPGQKAQLIKETGEEYIWDFLVDSSGMTLATGPAGKIIRISKAGKMVNVIETGEDHIMSLLKGADGENICGDFGRRTCT